MQRARMQRNPHAVCGMQHATYMHLVVALDGELECVAADTLQHVPASMFEFERCHCPALELEDVDVVHLIDELVPLDAWRDVKVPVPRDPSPSDHATLAELAEYRRRIACLVQPADATEYLRGIGVYLGLSDWPRAEEIDVFDLDRHRIGRKPSQKHQEAYDTHDCVSYRHPSVLTPSAVPKYPFYTFTRDKSTDWAVIKRRLFKASRGQYATKKN